MFDSVLRQLTGPAEDPEVEHRILQEALLGCAHDGETTAARFLVYRIAAIDYPVALKCVGVVLALRVSDEKGHVGMIKAILAHITSSTYGQALTYSDLRYALVLSSKYHERGPVTWLLNKFMMCDIHHQEKYEVFRQVVLCSSLAYSTTCGLS